jgi:hypothetical protein
MEDFLADQSAEVCWQQRMAAWKETKVPSVLIPLRGDDNQAGDNTTADMPYVYGRLRETEQFFPYRSGQKVLQSRPDKRCLISL